MPSQRPPPRPASDVRDDEPAQLFVKGRSRDERSCPRCFARVGIGRTCAVCGLAQTGARADRLRDLVARLSDLDQQRARMESESEMLVREREALLAAVAASEVPHERVSESSEPAWSVPGPGGPEFEPERVRDLLLWLGVVLLAVAALTFTIVTWSRLGEAGRAGLVLGMALVAGGGAVLLRRRVPATGEALCALGMALLLVWWYATRRAGALSGVDGYAWWALGAAVVGCCAFALARGWGFRCARVACAALAVAAAALTVGATTKAPWSAGAGLALVAAGSVVAASVVARHGGWRQAVVGLHVGAAAAEAIAFGVALLAVVGIDSTSEAVGPAVGVLALGLPPAFAAAVATASRRTAPTRDILVGLAVASALAALTTCFVGAVSPATLATISAGLGALTVVAARRAPRRLPQERSAPVS